MKLADGIASGRLDSSIDATGNDEVTQLLKSMQRMQGQLQSVMAAQGELARQHDAGSLSYRMDEKSIWRVFREAGDVAGIDGMHPHRARHTFIDRFLARTNDLVATQRAARHESVNTTTIYAQPHAAVMRKGYGFEE